MLYSHCSFFRIIYEPWVFFEAYKAYQNGQLCWNKYCNLIKSIMYSFMSVHYPRKPQENNATLVLVLPVYCTPMNVVEVIKKMCPQVKHVFSTRHPLASIRAISQVSWKVNGVVEFTYDNNVFRFNNFRMKNSDLEEKN